MHDLTQATFNGTVPRWEIDVNDHWNTMFYLRAFENAAERFCTSAGPGAGDPAPATTRHVRFFKELRTNETHEVRTGLASVRLAPYAIAHRLIRHGTGALCASALDLTDRPPSNRQPPAVAPPVDDEMIAARTLTRGVNKIADSAALLSGGGATISHVGILQRHDFDGHGALSMSGAHSRITDGTGQLWAHVGITADDFYKNGMGRALVEMKMSICDSCQPGDAVRLVSSFGDLGRRTIQLCHQLEDIGSGRVLASATGVMLVLDLSTRKSRAMPGFLIEALRRGPATA